MLTRNRRFMYFLAIVAAQSGCLAAGLWIHHRIVVSGLNAAVEEEALPKLAASAAEFLAAIGPLDLPGQAPGSADLEQARRRLQSKQELLGMQLALVDSQWKILSAPPAADVDSPPSESPGEVLDWITSSDDAGSGADRITGWLTMPDGRHLAFARRLNGRDGYVVAHCPRERVKLAPAILTGLLPAVGAVAWVWISALLAISVYIVVTKLYAELTKNRGQVETARLRHIQSLVRTRDAVVFGLAKLSESRDETTGHHLERIAAYALWLATTVRHHPKYSDTVTSEFLRLLVISSALHDIGKVGIEDSILLKPGRLTPEERARMQQHTTIGGECLAEVERRLGSSGFLQMAREITLWHHERWDGAGYPDGLAGEKIPLAARIVAIADVYDALSNRRVYKEALPHKECVALIHDGAGTQFDPDLVEAFLTVENVFQQIARQYANDTSDAADPTPSEAAASKDWQSEALVTLEAVLGSSPPDSTSVPNLK